MSQMIGISKLNAISKYTPFLLRFTVTDREIGVMLREGIKTHRRTSMA